MPPSEHSTAARGRPREGRDIERIRRASVAARTGSNPAMAVALAQIGAAFDEAAIINGFKLKIERLMRLGPDHPAVRARFRARAAMLYGRNLDASIFLVEQWWRDERRAFAIASAFGHGSRLSLEILGKIRLVLRLMRIKAWRRIMKSSSLLYAERRSPRWRRNNQ
jgi:hypothetical protein